MRISVYDMQISSLSIKMNTYKICLTIDIFDISNFSLFLTQHQQLQKTHKFVYIQFLIHISTNIYRNNTYNMSF